MLLQKDQIIDLDYLSVAEVAGPDAEKFLQGQTTVDIAEVSRSYSPFGAFCNHQGRIRALFRIVKAENGFFLITDRSNCDTFLQELKKYAVFFKVEINHLGSYRVYGSFTNPEPTTLDETNKTTTSNDVIVIKNQTADDSFIILSASVLESTNDRQLLLKWHHNEIKSGITNICSELFESLLPHYIKLPELGGVSFTKGCYTGQEIVARMHYKGKLKHQLYAFEVQINQLIPIGVNIIADEKVVGQVIRSTLIDSNTCCILVESKKPIESEIIRADFENQPILKLIDISLDMSHNKGEI